MGCPVRLSAPILNAMTTASLSEAATIDSSELRANLEKADPGVLVAVLAQLTGDPSVIDRFESKISYVPDPPERAGVTDPDTANLSDWPAPVPPTSRFSVEVASSCRSPVTVRVPAAAAPPGLMAPRLTSFAVPVPTTSVPLPDGIPLGLTRVEPLASAAVVHHILLFGELSFYGERRSRAKEKSTRNCLVFKTAFEKKSRSIDCGGAR